MTRVLFLDVDGVLNSAAWFASPACSRRRSRQRDLNDARSKLDPSAIGRLNSLLARAGGPHVVVSSTWRILYGERIGDLLQAHGVRATFAGRTPELREQGPAGLWLAAPRGREIQAWLDQHPEVERFVILDDDGGMEHLTPRLVQTTWQDGLQDEHVERAVALLAGE